MARKVHYSIKPNPKFSLVRDLDIELSEEFNKRGIDLNLVLDVRATLFIPKCSGSTIEPMNDGGFHLHQYSEDEFMRLPIEKQLGIIVPYDLQEESDEEFMFKAYVVEPVIII